jgi:hypothetical protein
LLEPDRQPVAIGTILKPSRPFDRGRYEPDAAYARGIADLRVLANLLPENGFLFGTKPSSIDAAIYGFTANIYFYEISTPLKEFILSKPNVFLHCQSIHAALER